MILITAAVSGLVGVGLGQRSLGASGIVFMMILLASTANIRKGEIPLTFIAVALIYLGGEIYAATTKNDNISHLGHLCGGISGAAFGFLGARLRGNGGDADKQLAAKPIKPALGASPGVKKR
jgi:membrane associated rhomboid family serine protease